MPSPIRFHLDESVDPDVARGLRQHGIDVTTTQEVGLRTGSDPLQWAFAVAEGRVLVTHDADFLRMAQRNDNHAGIIYCHKTSRSIGQIIQGLILISEVLTREDVAGRVEFL